MEAKESAVEVGRILIEKQETRDFQFSRLALYASSLRIVDI